MKPTLLIVDDEKLSGRILGIYFERKYNVTVLPSAEQAITWLNEGNVPKVIISDLEMETLSGKDLLKYVKAHDQIKDIPVIILSGTESYDTWSECLRLGASEYMVKPFNPIKLEAKLNELIPGAELSFISTAA